MTISVMDPDILGKPLIGIFQVPPGYKNLNSFLRRQVENTVIDILIENRVKGIVRAIVEIVVFYFEVVSLKAVLVFILSGSIKYNSQWFQICRIVVGRLFLSTRVEVWSKWSFPGSKLVDRDFILPRVDLLTVGVIPVEIIPVMGHNF
jgi:hypothetical protein